MTFHMDPTTLDLSNYPVCTCNNDTVTNLTMIADTFPSFKVAYVGGGNAAMRTELKDAFVNTLKAKNLDVASVPVSALKKLFGANQFNDERLHAEILIIDDFEETYGDIVLHEEIYHILKERIQTAKLTVIFGADSLYGIEERNIHSGLRQLLKAGNISTLHEENAMEELFFEGDFEQALTDIFFPKSGEMNCSEKEATDLAEFLLEMKDVHHKAGMWYCILAYMGIPGFEEQIAATAIGKYGTEEYNYLLYELFEDSYATETQLDYLKAKPFFYAAQAYLAEAYKETY